MFKQRYDANELIDDFSLSNDDLKKNLDEMELLNNIFGGKKTLLNALNKIYKKYSNYFYQRTISIADLGCGKGDLLRAIDTWKKSNQLNLNLIGIDANPFVIQYAKIKSADFPDIKYLVEDILTDTFNSSQFDIICINNVCHHFNNQTLIQLFKNLQKQAKLAIIINDLHRHWASYFAIKWVTKLFHFSYLSQHDGPLSVRRAFNKKDLINILQQAGINKFEIQWAWAFHWKVIIWCNVSFN